MILTITLNPSIDRRYSVDKFEKGKVFRCSNFQYTPGGKGINVAKVINTLGEPVEVTGFLGRRFGDYIEENLDDIGIEHRFVFVEGSTRSCLAILSDDGSQTEILEPGPFISEEDISKFYELYEKLIEKADIVCASGSIPKNVDVNIYKTLIDIANRNGKRFILDTSGEALKRGLEAKPYLIKPNKDELEKLIGSNISSEKDIINGVKSILKKGVNMVAVSLGGEGSLIFNDKYMYRVRIPKVNAVNPVGSGDSMIAGFAVSLLRNYDFETMLKLSSACGTANAMEMETGKVDLNNVKRFIEKIVIEKKEILYDIL